MLKITTDGRKLALDQRLLNPLLPDVPENKATACASKVFEIWQNTMATQSTQLIFSDLATPSTGEWNVYDDIRDKLIAKGIPKEQIAFIHDANTDAKKATLFAKVRAGKVRILMGSTKKMGAGTNVAADRKQAKNHIANHDQQVACSILSGFGRSCTVLRGNQSPMRRQSPYQRKDGAGQ